jgi:hypothetical protein
MILWAFPYGSGYSLQSFAFRGKKFPLLSLTQNTALKAVEERK